ncbi:MAG TPA: CoA-binding protein [Acidimicrobiia bacterium]|jgi:predicted CoA-binding protein|nr:CoA-binding protein [Acidimicrobiia bacterium]
MDKLTEILSRPDAVIAVVGATDNEAKYGSVIYRDLKRKGYRVYPVNPNRDTVDGDPVYATVAELPVAPDIIDLVVPPEVGVKVVQQALDVGYDRIWVQPGAESPELLTLLQESDADYIADACIMVRSRIARAG